MVATNTSEFTISVTGEVTGEKWYGKFKCKIRLSHRDQLLRDKIRRELLGSNPEAASPRAHNQAEVFSQITARLVDAPKWWSENGNGLDLADDNVIAEVYNACIKAEAEALEALKKVADEAKADLAKTKVE